MLGSTKSPAKSPEALLQRIRVSFPDLKWSGYTYLDEGWDHEVIILDNKYVFRFPGDEEYLRLLKNEVKILERLKPFVDIRIPQYRFIAPDFSFAGYPIVPGQTLKKEIFDALPAAVRTEIAKQLAGFLSSAHGFLQHNPDLAPLIRSYMKQDQQETIDQAKKYLEGVLTDQEYAIVHDILADVDKLLKQKLPAVFLHGDVYSRHLLWNDTDKRLGIIDFSDMNLGDPACDFAELFEYGDDFVHQVYSHYTGPKDEMFLERAWKYQRWVGVFMMTDHFMYHKTSFEVARETFDRVKDRSSI